jgi:hypothetical protein
LPEGCCLGHILENLAVLLTSLIHWHCVCHILTLSLTGVGPSGPALTYMQIPQAGSLACFKIKTVPI